MNEPEARVGIFLTGDPDPWDVAKGGEIVYRHPNDEYPSGRVISCDWILERTRPDGTKESRRAAHDDVTFEFGETQ